MNRERFENEQNHSEFTNKIKTHFFERIKMNLNSLKTSCCRGHVLHGLTLLILLLASARGSAGFMLTVSTSDNLTNLVAGNIVTFNVSLTNTDPFSNLNGVITTVVFDAALLGTPTNMSRGSIVPIPDNGALTLFASPGSAAFIFDTLGIAPNPGPISNPGQLFSFQVTVQPNVQGSGTVVFDQAGTGLFDSVNSQVGGVGFLGTNAFNVQVSAVPEPSSLSILVLAIGVGLASRLRKPTKALRNRRATL